MPDSQSSSSDEVSFACGACGKRYRWKAELAGRQVRCRCGSKMIFPLSPPGPESEEYEVAPSKPAPQFVPRPAPPPQSAAAPLAYQSPGASGPIDANFPDPVIDLYMPLALLAGAVVIEVLAALIHWRSTAFLGAELTSLAIRIVCGTAVMLAGILVAVKFRGIHLGPLPAALLKLAAITLAPGAAVTLASPLLSFIPFGFLIGWIGQFVLYFALLGALFSLDESDTWYCVCVIFVINVAIYFLLMGLRHWV